MMSKAMLLSARSWYSIMQHGTYLPSNKAFSCLYRSYQSLFIRIPKKKKKTQHQINKGILKVAQKKKHPKLSFFGRELMVCFRVSISIRDSKQILSYRSVYVHISEPPKCTKNTFSFLKHHCFEWYSTIQTHCT